MKKVNFSVFLPMFLFRAVLLISDQTLKDTLIDSHLVTDDRIKHSNIMTP